MSETEHKPWDWTPGLDNADHWAAFSYYLRLPPPRSLHLVAGAFGVTSQTIYGWASAENWRDRALSYDRALQAELQAYHQSEIREDAKQLQLAHRKLLTMQRSLLMREIEKLHKQVHDSPHTAIMSPRDLNKALNDVIKTERLVMGQATEIAGNELDLSLLSDIELEAYEQLVRKMRKNV